LTERAASTVLCAGGAVQDFIMQVDAFPEPGAKQPASAFVTTVGGQSGNAALAVARLGGQSRYAGPLGNPQDGIASWIVASLQGEGVDCGGVVRVPDGVCSAALIMVDASGEKLVSFRRGRGLTGIVPADPAHLVADVDAVLLDNRYPEFNGPIARAAAARGIPRVLDIDLGDPAGDPLLALCSHVIASADALRVMTGEQDPGAGLLALGNGYDGFLAVTNGPEGTFWREGDNVRHLPAFPVTAIDTLGAGDIFHAGFALRLAEGGDTVEAMRFGAAAAALKCTRFGGASGTPRRAEVEAFLDGPAGR